MPFQEQPDLVIRLGRAGKVIGKIEGLPPFESGEIMCTTTLVRLEGGEPPPAKAGKRRASASHRVNPQGEFEIAGLRPGTYRFGLVDFRAEGRFQNPSSLKRTLGEVEVKAGETAIFKASVQ